MQFLHLASSHLQRVFILLQGAFCPAEEDKFFQKKYNSSYMPLNRPVCSFFPISSASPWEMPRTHVSCWSQDWIPNPVSHAARPTASPSLSDRCCWWASGDRFYGRMNWFWTVSPMSWAQRSFSSSSELYFCWLPNFFFLLNKYRDCCLCRENSTFS